MISREQAADVARARARELGWGLREPLEITERRSWSGKVTRYNIASDPRMLGTKARFTIDAVNGLILDEGYIPR